MVNRFASAFTSEHAASSFGAMPGECDIHASWNIRPGQKARVVRRRLETRNRQLAGLTWGLLPYFVKSARVRSKLYTVSVEDVDRSRVTKAAFVHRRCLIPATAYYETVEGPEGERPYAVALIDQRPLALAGVWESWRNPKTGDMHETFALITSSLGTEMLPASHISASEDHEQSASRAPVIIKPADWALWLGETIGNAKRLLDTPQVESWRRWPVSRRLLTTGDDSPTLQTLLPTPQTIKAVRHDDIKE